MNDKELTEWRKSLESTATTLKVWRVYEQMVKHIERLQKERDEWKGTAEANAIQRDQASATCAKYREEAEKLKSIIMNHVYKHGCELGIDLEDDVNPWKAKAERFEKENEWLNKEIGKHTNQLYNIAQQCHKAGENAQKLIAKMLEGDSE